MKKIALLLLTLLPCVIQSAYSKDEGMAPQPVIQPNTLGLGLILGSPTGFNMKYWMHKKGAIDGALGFPFESDVKLNLHMDYLWHFPNRVNVPGELPLYVGLGGRLRAIDKPQHSQKVDLGIRIPLGIEFSPTHVPLNFFAELAPVVVFTPTGKLDLDGGAGVRYRFETTKSAITK